ncbi:MAG: hypothetical protein Fur0018_15730 [Anaerolineales bacterium]
MKPARWGVLLLLLGGMALFFQPTVRAQSPAETAVLVGQIFDSQGQSVEGAQVQVLIDEQLLAQAETQPDGSFALQLPKTIPYGSTENAPHGQTVLQVWADIAPQTPVNLQIMRAHFEPRRFPLSPEQVQTLRNGEILGLPPIQLERHIGIAFWLATLVFVGMLALIASSKIHNTLATLSGAALVFAISYLGTPFQPSVFIFHFERALHYVDWNVIFLILGMMIVIAVVERTGIFQWMAFRAYRISGGRLWLLLPILMLITGLASAFLDNVTTMLLMTPITIQIALAMGVNPLALLLPEVFASNVVGISTLIGTPTNILIGSYAGISFNDFLRNLTPGVVLAFVGLIAYV